jgi:hypothetical protein
MNYTDWEIEQGIQGFYMVVCLRSGGLAVRPRGSPIDYSDHLICFRFFPRILCCSICFKFLIIQGENLQCALTFRKWNVCFLYIESDTWFFTTFGCLMLEKMIYSLTCSSVVLFVQKHGLVLLCDHWFAYFMLHICNFFLSKGNIPLVLMYIVNWYDLTWTCCRFVIR